MKFAGEKKKSQRDISSFPLIYQYNNIILFDRGIDKNPQIIVFTLSIYMVIVLFYLLYGVGLLPIRQYLFKRVVRVYRPCLYFYLNIWGRISAHTSTFTLSQIYFYLKYDVELTHILYEFILPHI